MYIYYCPKCNGLESFIDMTGDYMCQSCRTSYLPLKVTVDEWNNLSNEDMLLAIKKAKKPTIKTPVFSSEIESMPNDNNKPFCMPVIKNSAHGRLELKNCWCITGCAQSYRDISTGDMVDIVGTDQEVIATLPVFRITIWADKIQNNINVKENEICLAFDGQSQNTALKNAQYIILHGNPIISADELERVRAEVNKVGPIATEEYLQSRMVPEIKCPYCNSTDCTKLGLLNKSASIAFWGFASNKIGKQWKCNSCGSMF